MKVKSIVALVLIGGASFALADPADVATVGTDKDWQVTHDTSTANPTHIPEVASSILGLIGLVLLLSRKR